MSVDPKPRPLNHLWTTAREYLTHWFTAGVILTLTGFTPDHWVERLFHGLKLDNLRDALPAVDYRLLAVGVATEYLQLWRARCGGIEVGCAEA